MLRILRLLARSMILAIFQTFGNRSIWNSDDTQTRKRMIGNASRARNRRYLRIWELSKIWGMQKNQQGTLGMSDLIASRRTDILRIARNTKVLADPDIMQNTECIESVKA